MACFNVTRRKEPPVNWACHPDDLTFELGKEQQQKIFRECGLLLPAALKTLRIQIIIRCLYELKGKPALRKLGLK
jgi:hypothetical protein